MDSKSSQHQSTNECLISLESDRVVHLTHMQTYTCTVDFAYKAPLRPAILGAFYPIEPFVQNDDFFPYQGKGCNSIMTKIKCLTI